MMNELLQKSLLVLIQHQFKETESSKVLRWHIEIWIRSQYSRVLKFEIFNIFDAVLAILNLLSILNVNIIKPVQNSLRLAFGVKYSFNIKYQYII